MNETPISRRTFAKGVATGVGGALLSPLWGRAAAAAGERPRPNVVFIVSDQHSYKYSGFMGHPIVETPNLDRIARRGAVFRNTYCGSPVCTPSRASLMSGAYPSDCTSFCNATVWDGSVPTWPKLLREAGYHTFATGKMDIDPAFDLGLAQETGVTHGHASDPDVTGFFRRPLCSRIDERRLVDGRARQKPHHDAIVFGSTVDNIRSRAQKNQPWMAYCGSNMPHPGFVGLQEHYERYFARIDEPVVPAGHLEELHWVYRQMRHFKDIATPYGQKTRSHQFSRICQVIRRLRAGHCMG